MSSRSSDDPTTSTDYASYQSTQQLRSIQQSRTEQIKTAIDALYSTLASGDREGFALRFDRLRTMLPITVDVVHHVNAPLSDSDLDWYATDLLDYLDVEHPEKWIDSAPESRLRRLTLSTTAMAVAMGDLDVRVQSEQPAYEYETRVGTRYVSPTSQATGELELIDPDGDLKATLCTGSQGAGKSTAVGTLIEDRIARGHAVVDLVDFHKSENAVYDIEGKEDEELQGYREEHGLETGFSGDYEPPTVDIRAPLTHDLADSRIPVDTETGEPKVKPFTIPASDLTFRQIVMLLPHTTKTQQGYIKSAHQLLSQRGGNWNLYDLAEAIRHRTNAGDKVADRIERALETAQKKSFIRDSESRHQLDWREIMDKERHVTAFTVHMIREKSDKLAIASYLLDRLYDARNELVRRRILDEYPPLTAVMRELHTIAPRTKSEQDAEKTIEGYMTDTLSELLALMRHANMDVVADTQKFHQQLSPRVSGLFHRVYCFSGQRPDVKHVFKTRIDDTDPAERVAQYETGMCALVSSDGYSLPIKMAPPRHHHLDASTDGDGLSFRAKALDSEELDEAPWSADVPPRLRFGSRFDPREEFWEREVRETGNPKDTIIKRGLTENYNRWAADNDYKQTTHKSFCGWIKNNTDIDDGQPSKGGRRRWSWKGVEFKKDR
jgi:hypothetical protein